MSFLLDRKICKKINDYVNEKIPNSYTRMALKRPIPITDRTYTTINEYRNSVTSNNFYKKALETGCGNCEEMAFAAGYYALEIRYPGYIAIATFGLNHVFCLIGDFILDCWSNDFFPYDQWKFKLKGYGGSIKDGFVNGWLLDANHYELEDEEPEVMTIIQEKPKVNQYFL